MFIRQMDVNLIVVFRFALDLDGHTDTLILTSLVVLALDIIIKHTLSLEIIRFIEGNS